MFTVSVTLMYLHTYMHSHVCAHVPDMYITCVMCDSHYESIQEVRSSEPVTPLTPSGQHELYSQVFDALPKGKSTKKPTKESL